MADKRFVISEDDLAPDEPPAPEHTASTTPAPPPPAGDPPLWSDGDLPPVTGVRREQHQLIMDLPPVAGPPRPPGVGTVAAPRPTGTSPGFFRSIRGQSLLAGLAAIVPGWIVTEVFGIANWAASAFSEGAVNFRSAVWVAVIAAVFAAVYNGWEEITTQRWADFGAAAGRSAIIGGGLGFVSGFIASAIFIAMTKNADSLTGLYVIRAIGWGVFGAGLGGATSALLQNAKKLQNGIFGGAIGGAIGGVMFLWFSIHIDSQGVSRLLGLDAIGGCIGLAIGIIEVARRDAWLHIVGGGMAGKEFILYEPQTAIGSSPKCGVTLIKDPGIQPQHFMIAEAAGGRHQLAPYEGAQVLVNGAPVSQHTLRSGDVIQAGQTSIRYAERSAA